MSFAWVEQIRDVQVDTYSSLIGLPRMPHQGPCRYLEGDPVHSPPSDPDNKEADLVDQLGN